MFACWIFILFWYNLEFDMSTRFITNDAKGSPGNALAPLVKKRGQCTENILKLKTS